MTESTGSKGVARWLLAGLALLALAGVVLAFALTASVFRCTFCYRIPDLGYGQRGSEACPVCKGEGSITLYRNWRHQKWTCDTWLVNPFRGIDFGLTRAHQ